MFTSPSKKLCRLTLLLFLINLTWSCSSLEQSITSIPSSEQELSDQEIELALEKNFDLETAYNDATLSPQEELTMAEPEATIDQELQDLEKLGSWEQATPSTLPEEPTVTYDFPITMNRQVEYYLDFFQNRQRTSFARWLARSGRYVPMIKQQLEEAGLPLDLAYLPMIESGFSLTAYSRAKAVGPWQFMRGTGLNYGLKINNYVDERRNPIKSTKAAIAYLKELHNEFGSWELAVAAYNAGEGKIRRAIKRYKTDSFWTIAEKDYLHVETKRYVPKLIAAILIANSPEKYGFSNIDYEQPLSFDYADVPRWTTLQAVATALSIDIEEIRLLNKELRKEITPPDQKSYRIIIPANTKTLLSTHLPRVYPVVNNTFKTHIVRRNETLAQICKKYDLNKTTLLKANNLRKSKLQAGQRLRIPYQETRYVLLTEKEAKSQRIATNNGDFILHKIRPGETISQVATKYNIPTHLIAAWNGIKDINKIKAGQQLSLYINNGGHGSSKHESSPKASVDSKSGHRSIVLADARKKIVPQKKTYYHVKGGDNLWKIAQQFKLQPDDIKKWNNLKDNTIHPGLKLLLKL